MTVLCCIFSFRVIRFVSYHMLSLSLVAFLLVKFFLIYSHIYLKSSTLLILLFVLKFYMKLVTLYKIYHCFKNIPKILLRIFLEVLAKMKYMVFITVKVLFRVDKLTVGVYTLTFYCYN